MRAYYFMPLEFVRQNLERRRLKLSLIDDLNDPYELFGIDLSQNWIRDAYSATREHMAKTKGVICLCQSWEYPIMWSHYGDKHRGVCLGFDIAPPHGEAMRYAEKRIVLQPERWWTGDASSPRQAH